MKHDNHWVNPFESALDLASVETAITCRPAPLDRLTEGPPTVGANRLEDALEALYIPTPSALEWLTEIAATGLAHALTKYPDSRTVKQAIYHPSKRVEPGDIHCLTGLAGLGKSETVRALGRLMGAATWHAKLPDHAEFALIPAVIATVGARTTDRRLIENISEQLCTPGPDPRGQTELLKHVTNWTYRRGTCILAVDELQFLSMSATANAGVTKAILLLSMLGLPLFFVCNYSLGHRLLKRNQEDRQRLLGRVRVMLPEAADSTWWHRYITEICRIARCVLQIHPSDHAALVHGLTAGIPRLLRHLIGIAFRIACEKNHRRPVVTADHLRQAYASAAYHSNRLDVEALLANRVARTRIRSDLACPFNLASHLEAQELANLRYEHKLQVRRAALRNSLLPDEQPPAIAKIDEVIPASRGASREIRRPHPAELHLHYEKWMSG